MTCVDARRLVCCCIQGANTQHILKTRGLDHSVNLSSLLVRRFLAALAAAFTFATAALHALVAVLQQPLPRPGH